MGVMQALEHAANEGIFLEIVEHEGCEPDVVPTPRPLPHGDRFAPMNLTWLDYVTASRRGDITALLGPVSEAGIEAEPPCPRGRVFDGDTRSSEVFRRLFAAVTFQQTERARRAYGRFDVAREHGNAGDVSDALLALREGRVREIPTEVIAGRCYAFVATRSGWSLDADGRSVWTGRVGASKPQTTENAP